MCARIVKLEPSLRYRVETRITEQKFAELSELLQKSSCRNMSELLRSILENRKIVIKTYDHSLDKIMEQLSGVRKELNAIGVNINQAVRKLNCENSAESRLFQTLEIARLYQQTDLKVSELFTIISNLSELWLPK